jgi:anti-anti-sigma factor
MPLGWRRDVENADAWGLALSRLSCNAGEKSVLLNAGSCGADGRCMADAFRIERYGDVAVVIPSSEVESLQWELIEQAADLVVGPISQMEPPLVIVDLSEVEYFGSVFLSLLLRTWKSVFQHGGTMVLCGVSERAAELLKLTALDTLWAIYDTREEARAVLASD